MKSLINLHNMRSIKKTGKNGEYTEHIEVDFEYPKSLFAFFSPPRIGTLTVFRNHRGCWVPVTVSILTVQDENALDRLYRKIPIIKSDDECCESPDIIYVKNIYNVNIISEYLKSKDIHFTYGYSTFDLDDVSVMIEETSYPVRACLHCETCLLEETKQLVIEDFKNKLEVKRLKKQRLELGRKICGIE